MRKLFENEVAKTSNNIMKNLNESVSLKEYDDNEPDIEVYFNTYGAYNSGNNEGSGWIKDKETGLEYLEANQDEEVFIADINSNPYIEIGENETPEAVLDFMDIYNYLEWGDKRKVQALYSGGILSDLSDIENYVNYHLIDASNAEDLAYYYVDAIGGVSELGDSISSYFDYEAFGRDLFYDIDGLVDGDEERAQELREMEPYNLATYYINDILGSVDELGQETLERYFDYDSFGSDIANDYYDTDFGYIEEI